MRPHRNGNVYGFSLVELLVALMFTMILMAGLSVVFKSSLGAAVASSEGISSLRRNREAMELLYDDLNLAGMLPSTLFDYPSTDPKNPPFLVTPNVAFTGTDIPTASANADQLMLYYDNTLPFEGSLASTLQNTSQQVAAGGSLGDNALFSIDFRDSTQAAQVASAFATAGLNIIFKSSGYCYKLASAAQHGTTNKVDVTLSDTGGYTGSGNNQGATFIAAANSGSAVTLVQPGRYIRYSIQARALDPENPSSKAPCLMREEVGYADVSSSSNPFQTPTSSTLVAENVIGFKVMLSGDGGVTWAGGNTTDTAWSDIATALNTVLSSKVRTATSTGTASSPFWFREIPVLVRVDVTTRTIRKRTEFGTPTTADYQIQTRSLILNPRHFGLAYQPVS